MCGCVCVLQCHHLDCYSESPCQQVHVSYQLKSKVLTMSDAICALKKNLMYSSAESFCRVCCILGIINSHFCFLVQGHLQGGVLTYLPKRIHFHTATFMMRMNRAVMDWVSCMYLLIYCAVNDVTTFVGMKTHKGPQQVSRYRQMFAYLATQPFPMYWWPKHFGL